MEKISICIPTHNRPNYLEKAVESVLDQSYRNFQICISDNSTNSHSNNMIKKYGDIIKYHKVPANTPPAINQDKAVKLANTVYATFLADDDLLGKHYLKTMIAISQSTGSKLVRAAGNFIDAKSNIIGKFGKYPRTITDTEFIIDRLHHNFYSGLTGYLFNVKDYHGVGGISDVGFVGSLFADDYLWFRLAIKSKTVSSSSKPLWSWRKHPHNAGASIDINRFIANVDSYIEVLDYYFNTHSEDYQEIHHVLANIYRRNVIISRLQHEYTNTSLKKLGKKLALLNKYLNYKYFL